MWPVWATIQVFGRPLMLTGYGVFAFLGASLGVVLCVLAARRAGFPVFDAFAAAVLALAGGLVGAKFLFLTVSLPRILAEGVGPFLVHGGLVWFGGVLGGGAAAVWYLRAYRLDVLRFLDLTVAPLALGHALGRVGCLMGGCCHGRATALPWGIAFQPTPFFSGPTGTPLHPVQLYEAFGELILAMVAWRLAGRVPSGGRFVAWATGYCLLRLANELFFRGDDRGAWLAGLSPSSALATAVLGVVAALGVRRLTRETKVS